MSTFHSFIELASVDSTNNYAMAQVHAGLAFEGNSWFAYEQWAGKGQRGKTWTSNPGDNIILSMVLEPVFLGITRQFPLSAAIALGCRDFYVHYTGPDETSIKWPNDLYWRDRKAGGILIENVFKGDKWAFAIAGMGININQVQFPPTARNPVSLKQITGRTFEAPVLARELTGFVFARYEQLRAGEEEALLHEYNQYLFRRETTVRLRKENAVFETRVESVSPTGELITRDTLERRFRVGEIEWL